MALDIKPSDLIKVKRIRAAEIDVFDFWFPFAVSLITIVLCASPFVGWLNELVVFIRDCLVSKE